MKVLYIGGTGMIGSARVAGTVARGHDVPTGRPAAVDLPAESSFIAAPDRPWPAPILGDPAHCAVHGNSKINRYVPSYRPVITWSDGVRRPPARRTARAGRARPDAAADALQNRLVEAHPPRPRGADANRTGGPMKRHRPGPGAPHGGRLDRPNGVD